MNRVLSPFSFYGGKAKMSSLIVDMLDYNNTDIYIEPFGGACRVLLNKPRHREEIYNDFGAGLYSFFSCMSKPEQAKKVISALYDIVPSEKVFNENKEYKIMHETELTDYMRLQFKRFVFGCGRKYHSKELRKLHSHIIRKEYQDIIDIAEQILTDNIIQDDEEKRLFRHYLEQYQKYLEIVKNKYEDGYKLAEETFEETWKQKEKEISEKKRKNKEQYKHDVCHTWALQCIEEYTSDTLISNGADITKSTDMGDCIFNPVDMAVATFVSYYMSRDGMGLNYSEEKCSSPEAYYRQLLKLENVAERFEGVAVMQIDAVFLTRFYCNYKNAMIYLDPSYLDPESSTRDLGKGVYNRSFDYNLHKKLAEIIQKANAHIILSNYDVSPYKDLLTEEYGWKRIEFETTTSVGSKTDNERIEVLWYNY